MCQQWLSAVIVYTKHISFHHSYRTKQHLISRRSIHTDINSNAKMYPKKPPSRSNFNPRVPSLTRMPSPPDCIRPLVERLNRTPSRARKAAPCIKTEPVETPSTHSSDADHLTVAYHHPPTSQSNHDEGSIPSSTSTKASNDSALSQALVNMLNTPSTNNKTPALDFRGCRVEIIFHVHPCVRPAFPPRYSRTERLKRKRESHDIDQVEDGGEEEALERQVKKIKLSHDSEDGLKIRGQAKLARKSQRTTVADGVKARSRAGLRRVSSRRLDAGRGGY